MAIRKNDAILSTECQRLTQLLSMLLHRHPHSSRRFIVTITYIVITLFHQVEGFPVLVKKAGVELGSPPPSILPSSDAIWFDDSAATMSTLVKHSSYDALHDSVFIPTIVTMGVLVIICIFCIYALFVYKDTAHSEGANYQGPILTSQHAVGRMESGYGSRPLSGVSKATQGSALSTSASVPVSPSVGSSNMLDRLQRRREEGHLKQLKQQDPYEQYIAANQGNPYPQKQSHYTPHSSVASLHHGEGVQPQLPHSGHVSTAKPLLMNVNHSHYTPHSSVASLHHGEGVQPQLPHSAYVPTAQPPLMNVNYSQYTPHPSVRGSVQGSVQRGERVQPQVPHSAHVPSAQPSLMNVNPSQEQRWSQQERQSLQQSDPRWGVPLSPAAQMSSTGTRVSSDVLSYMTPPEARRPPLPNNSENSPRPQNQDYFNSQHPGGGIPLQTQPSTHGDIAHSIPASLTPRNPSSTNSVRAAHVHDYNNNQPPGYSATEMMGKNVQGNVPSTTPYWEQHKS